MSTRIKWSDDQANTLKKLWGTGLTTSEIAKRIGSGLSKNAVIGKANRLGLSKGAQAVPAPDSAPTPMVKSKKDYMAKILALEEEKKQSWISCNWPEGDPRDETFAICGEETKKSRPYCKKHMARAYNKKSG